MLEVLDPEPFVITSEDTGRYQPAKPQADEPVVSTQLMFGGGNVGEAPIDQFAGSRLDPKLAKAAWHESESTTGYRVASARADDAMSVKTDDMAARRALVWPEIKDSQALINFVKLKIAEFNKQNPGVVQNVPTNLDREFDYLRPRECWLGRASLGIILDTHPYTGQAVLVAPDPEEYWQYHKQQRADVIPTKAPEISFGLANISPNASGLFESMEGESVRWLDFRNLDKETSSWPQPLEMRYPAFPTEFLRIGMTGRAKIIISISERGLATISQLDVTSKELESPMRDAVQAWRFEPGVDLKTRMPTKTRMSLTVNFDLKMD